MLPSSNRLPLTNNNFRKFDKTISDPHFIVKFNKGSKNTLEAAIIVTKSVAPKAVDRNRIKRIIAECLKDKLNLNGQLLIKVKTNISDLKKDQVQQKLNELFKKL